MKGILILAYGVLCYTLFFLSFLYAVAFVGDFVVPRTVDDALSGPLSQALIVNLALLGLFAVQHSGMARRGFKAWLTRWLPASLERSTYVLLSSLALILLFWQWRELPATIWSIETPWAAWLLYALFAFGWLLVLTGTFVIDHFDLFGLRQVWLRARGRAYTAPEFKEHFYYRLVRHPLMLGFIIAFWATPEMTAGHLLFAVATTGYILLALQLEERDLIHAHGEDYRQYQRRVPMVCPFPRPRGEATASQPETDTTTAR